MIHRHFRKKPIADMNVVPYIDVMLVLLVIFMITAPLLKQELSVHLPETTAQALAPQTESPTIITIDAHGQYYLNTAPKAKKAIPLDHLIDTLARLWQTDPQKNQRHSVYIEGDQAVNYGIVVQLMGRLKNAGIEKVSLITTPPPPSESAETESSSSK